MKTHSDKSPVELTLRTASQLRGALLLGVKTTRASNTGKDRAPHPITQSTLAKPVICREKKTSIFTSLY